MDLSSFHETAQIDLDNIRKMCLDIVDVKIISPDRCNEMYPCHGHGGVYLVCRNGDKVVYKCDSVSIACIQRVYLGDMRVDPHFRGYTKGFVY